MYTYLLNILIYFIGIKFIDNQKYYHNLTKTNNVCSNNERRIC
jgi:hypothetical protein